MLSRKLEQVRAIGRNTQGVRLIRIGGDDKLVAVEKLDADVAGEESGESPSSDQKSE